MPSAATSAFANPRLAELAGYLDRQWDALAEAVASVPADRRGEAPGRGRWSTAGVLEHLSLVEGRLAASWPKWIEDARAAGVPAETDVTPVLPTMDLARLLSRETRIASPAPVRPTGRLDADAAWQALSDARAGLARAIAAADGLALGAIVKPHAVFGPFTMYQWIGFVGAHRARHAAQIRDIGAALRTERLWTDVDRYLVDSHVRTDAALDAALAASAAAGLPPIQVSAPQGRWLQVLARLTGARAILEIGTLGGYSTICLARGLAPGGRLVTLEIDPRHAEVARANVATAGLGGVVAIRVGPALETLPALAGPFDLVFIDADKPNIPEYFTHALRLTRPGGAIVVDNVIRDGGVIDAASQDPDVQGVRRFHAQLAAEPRVLATTLQTVGNKGYDGFTIAVAPA